MAIFCSKHIAVGLKIPLSTDSLSGKLFGFSITDKLTARLYRLFEHCHCVEALYPVSRLADLSDLALFILALPRPRPRFRFKLEHSFCGCVLWAWVSPARTAALTGHFRCLRAIQFFRFFCLCVLRCFHIYNTSNSITCQVSNVYSKLAEIGVKTLILVIL